MDKANVTFIGGMNLEQVDIKDPTEGEKIAKAVDDYMNNETEDLILPKEEEREPQSLEEALLGE